MTREERLTWERRRDEFEAPILEAARREGRLVVIDCTLQSYPVPPAILAELHRMSDPDVRERGYREAQALHRKSKSLQGLALVLDRDGKGDQAESMRVKAAEREAAALALEDTLRV